MSDKLYTYPIDKLVKWILADLENDKVFGITKSLFFYPSENDPFRLKRYGQLLETPIGVAAGPHTQLSHNIILSWLMGARYIELKTVQTLDELEVTKPCIEMGDEGYNCEWSQELKIHQSFDEYLNAWIIIHLLKDKFGWQSDEAGFIFNLSVGYNLEGIKKPNVQWFFDKMNNCSEELEIKVEQISKIYPRIKELKIPTKLSDNITLSTMHGCPPDEIESIVEYLITKRRLHTAVKLNPTLLGREKLREILNIKLGYETIVPDEAFDHDLKWEEAVGMIERLTVLAEKHGVKFGLKLTNTLESLNSTERLPRNENMVYMSGRALHPISINLAAKLQKQFNGELDISFSAGVDAFNVAETLACNLKPITVCSDLLKPGGYTRLAQYFAEMRNTFKENNSTNIEQLVLSKNSKSNIETASVKNLGKYAEKVLSDNRYKKENFKYESIKTKRELTTYDCIHAPCVETCAISQDVPEYMYHTANGNFAKAFEVIEKTNPLPNITGMVCDHLCQSKCTRMNYDSTLLIREIKRFVSEKESASFRLQPKPTLGIKAAIIGAGPAGLSAAYFLALEGVEVHLYETKSFAGGMAADAIPIFRIKEESLKQDIANIESLGVKFHYNTKMDSERFKALQNNFDYIFIAIGAQKGKKLNVEGESLPGVYDQITFLADVLRGKEIDLGKNVAIIGGGLSAVDAARTVNRIIGKDGKVTVLYRRTKNEMPCGREEVDVMIEEGIEIVELTTPEKILRKNKGLEIQCYKMELAEKDSSGRRRPIKIQGSEFSLDFDSIITAIGQDIELDFFPEKNIQIDQSTLETELDNVFAGGDAVRGADSLINAIADGQKVAERILRRIEKTLDLKIKPEKKLTEEEFQHKLALRVPGGEIPSIPLEERHSFEMVHPTLTEEQAIAEAERCLYCNDVCNICVTVCPNLANVAIQTEPVEIKIPGSNNSFVIEQSNQIINVGDFCNECGNCTTFCPTSGDPYKTKPKLYLTEESFDKEDNCYLMKGNSLMFKSNGEMKTLTLDNSKFIYKSEFVNIEFDSKDYSVIGHESNLTESNSKDLSKAVEMIFLLKNLKENSLMG